MNRNLESAFNIFKDDLLKVGDEMLEHVLTSRRNTIYCLIRHSLDNLLYLYRISDHSTAQLRYWEMLQSEHLGILIHRVPTTHEEWISGYKNRNQTNPLAVMHDRAYVPIAVRDAMKAISS